MTKNLFFFRRVLPRLVIGGTVTAFFMFVLAAFAAVPAKSTPPEIARELFREVRMFADAITLISTEYVKQVEVKDLVHGAIRGMMKTLDGYSQFLDKDSFQEIKEETKGEFGGIGITIGIRDGVLTIIAPMEGAPAFEAGLEAGDKVVKIDGEITRDMTLDESVRKLRGRPGSEVSITVMRDDDIVIDVTLERAVIQLKSVKESKMVAENIAYIRVTEFQERTARDVDAALTELKQEGAKGVVLDLRNNPGGLLDSAIEVSEKFLPKGTLIVYTEGREETDRMDFFSGKRPTHDDINLIVLINKGSASAAEIMAGALQDSRRALLVGEATFGKGSVQTVIPLRDRSALRLTTAAYYTPSGRNLMDKGIEPDILVKAPPRRPVKDAVEDKKDDPGKLFEELESREDPGLEPEVKVDKPRRYPRIEDPQLRTAVDILRGVLLYRYASPECVGEADPPSESS